MREYGIRLDFLPVITPRGTIRMKVAPEVSSLDYGNAVRIGGFTVPALLPRRKVKTTVELESGQTFVIAGLLDNDDHREPQQGARHRQYSDAGRLFQSRVAIEEEHQELLVYYHARHGDPDPGKGSHCPNSIVPRPSCRPEEVPLRPSSPDWIQTGRCRRITPAGIAVL